MFNSSQKLTLGVELELQIIDPITRDLAPASPKILAALGEERGDIKPEVFQSMIEVSTGICRNTDDARRDFEKSVGDLRTVCDDLGLALACAGSHPFARFDERVIYPAERYEQVLSRFKWLAQHHMIFGLHIHLGMRDGPHAVAMLNGMLHYLPHLLAISASSPFWQGSDTGLES